MASIIGIDIVQNYLTKNNTSDTSASKFCSSIREINYFVVKYL